MQVELSAFNVFLGIAAVGFLFLLVSLVFGGIFESLHHDGGFEHGMEHGGPSFFSPRILSVFITAFGCFGAIATHYGVTAVPASGVGVLSGFVFSGIIFAFARFLYSQQATSEVRSTDVIGQSARVVVAIPAGGVGQVRCRLGEELIDRIARSRDGAAIAENTVVKIEEVLGETVIVSRQ